MTTSRHTALPRVAIFLAAAIAAAGPAMAAKGCSPGTWLEVDGQVETPIKLSKKAFFELPSQRITTQTNWSKGQDFSFDGPALADVLAMAKPRQGWTTLRLMAVNDYATTITADDVKKYRPIVSHSMNGAPHNEKKYAPTWLIFPRNNFKELEGPAGTAMFIWGLCKVTVQR